ncbi:capsule biosynthesis protein [Acidithiobacillus caldus]|uniref:Capsular biosynthesis protein n=1 Tax=Acidithiobacillus caldus TaxID=33059 RepID=A0A1E7YIW2_9PROT|nr:capsular biosynthesis protein [Acidithiobacillus caldus]OFC28264.1 hypothetical protein BAE27_15720 [Acidithiobacillus caldus]OFC30398.1 hypothetical protein BAE28_14190 [Acidithiobacillus caldus]OFC41083.1 hypothetical protein BAE29_03770 [Acidithiobacillus caldus]
MSSGSRAHIVFLQGMPSPFFRRVGVCLVEAGWRVTRINLSAGDWLFWHDDHAINYRGSLADWPAFLHDFFQREGVSDLFLLGEQRRYHKEAVAIAKGLGIRVTVTDFGYLRPDWITLERDGMCGNSHFPKDAQSIHAIARQAVVLDWEQRFVDSAYQMAVGDLAQNYANILGWPFFPRYQRSDMRPPTILYTMASGWRLLGNRLRKTRTLAQCEELWNSGRSYYLFPIQLNFDFQMVAYSPFPRMETALELVLDSFLRCAPRDALLVVKEHPWDPALPDWERYLHRRRRELQVEDRLVYLRGGDLNGLIQRSRGVVLVNSSTGLRALQLHRPLKALGSAVFDVPGLTFQGSLDDFWTQGTPPDPQLREDFFTALAATVQVRGVFFQEPGVTEAVTETCYRLRTHTVGKLVYPHRSKGEMAW